MFQSSRGLAIAFFCCIALSFPCKNSKGAWEMRNARTNVVTRTDSAVCVCVWPQAVSLNFSVFVSLLKRGLICCHVKWSQMEQVWFIRFTIPGRPLHTRRKARVAWRPGFNPGTLEIALAATSKCEVPRDSRSSNKMELKTIFIYTVFIYIYILLYIYSYIDMIYHYVISIHES